MLIIFYVLHFTFMLCSLISVRVLVPEVLSAVVGLVSLVHCPCQIAATGPHLLIKIDSGSVWLAEFFLIA
jgi:hypothetical protein